MLIRAVNQRVSILSGPKKDKFTNLKHLIFWKDSFSSSISNTQISSGLKNASVGGSSSCVMVYDYIEHDLMGLIRIKIKFSAAQIKYILKEILEAVGALHIEHIEHGHLKSKNVLPKPPTSI